MEDRAWELVEKFISGEAAPRELCELRDLLKENRELFTSVRGFLETYKDPDPQITEEDKRRFLSGITEDDPNAIFFQTGATLLAKGMS